jgi:hypothetical protein
MSVPRGDVDFVGHNLIPATDQAVAPTVPINNIVIKAHRPEDEWKEQAMRKIGDWRAKLRSTYMRWALAINGLEVAAARYAEPAWAARHKFTVTSLRKNGEVFAFVPIAEWDGPTASDAHAKTMPTMAAFGVIDLYANLEEVVFDLYRIYLNHHPEVLLRGDDFKSLRELRSEAANDAGKRQEWEAAWEDRLDKWQREKLYTRLGKVFRALCSTAGIKTPSAYKHTTTETWAESIETIALVRNALIHGATTVSAELADACARPHAMTFDFELGRPLEVKLIHLQGVDLFCEQLLDGVNWSLVEMMPDSPGSSGP